MANVGSLDRILRLALGVLLIAAPYLFQVTYWENPVIRWAVPAVGLILVVTALFRFCPLYRIVGMRTNSK